MISKHVFGPVPSRRLGFSLGVDIIPMKTCTLNCVYCQLFQTSNYELDLKSFFDRNKILQDIEKALSKFNNIDFVTFSGSGEPTLSLDLGWLISEVKKISNTKIAVITNSSLLWNHEVRNNLKHADLVVPSFDAFSEDIFLKLNRPHPSIQFDKIKEGLKEFCNSFSGDIWLEIMLVKDFNDDIEEIKKIANFANTLKVSKVQINTVVRPPNESYAKPIEQKFLQDMQSYFHLPTEIIAPFSKEKMNSEIENILELIIETLARRPCQERELSVSLGIRQEVLNKYLQMLEKEQKICIDQNEYYSLNH